MEAGGNGARRRACQAAGEVGETGAEAPTRASGHRASGGGPPWPWRITADRTARGPTHHEIGSGRPAVRYGRIRRRRSALVVPATPGVIVVRPDGIGRFRRRSRNRCPEGPDASAAVRGCDHAAPTSGDSTMLGPRGACGGSPAKDRSTGRRSTAHGGTARLPKHGRGQPPAIEPAEGVEAPRPSAAKSGRSRRGLAPCRSPSRPRLAASPYPVSRETGRQRRPPKSRWPSTAYSAIGGLTRR